MSGCCRRCGDLGVVAARGGLVICPLHGCIAGTRLVQMAELVDAAWREGTTLPSRQELEAYTGAMPSAAERE